MHAHSTAPTVCEAFEAVAFAKAQHTHTHISSIADRTTLSAKCHRSSIQYTSYRPVNRLLIQTALILSRFLLHMLCVNVSPTFVILSFRIFILNFVFG